MFVLSTALIFSLALAELVKPLFVATVSFPALTVSGALSLLLLLLAVLHLHRMTWRNTAVGDDMAKG